MGGGNAQKSATARARNEAKKAKAAKGSQLAVNKAAQSIVCQVCFLLPLSCVVAKRGPNEVCGCISSVFMADEIQMARLPFTGRAYVTKKFGRLYHMAGFAHIPAAPKM